MSRYRSFPALACTLLLELTALPGLLGAAKETNADRTAAELRGHVDGFAAWFAEAYEPVRAEDLLELQTEPLHTRLGTITAPRVRTRADLRILFSRWSDEFNVSDVQGDVTTAFRNNVMTLSIHAGLLSILLIPATAERGMTEAVAEVQAEKRRIRSILERSFGIYRPVAPPPAPDGAGTAAVAPAPVELLGVPNP